MIRRAIFVTIASLAVLLAMTPQTTRACPFCAAVAQTFSEEINTMDAVVIARLVEPPMKSSSSPDGGTAVTKARFKVEEVIKGESLLGDQKTIETLFFGEAKPGQLFLIMGVDPPKLMWSTPLALSDRAHKYIKQVVKLPPDGPERLAFFQDYLEDEDEVLARDAYDEFAKAPYADVKALKMKMKHDKVVEWIQDTDVPASRRRLYFVMLGVCGGNDDLMMLEEMMQSDDRKQKAGLDSMIACYLTLKGADGMPLVEELFLKNKKAEYADTYAAIMALRFHGTESDVIPRARLLEGLRHMLDRPDLADLVIPDLARWQDWSVMEKLVKLFKEADDKSSWVRVPVINYLRACPEPEAKEYIEELEKIDPAAVKRANTFFPYTQGDGTSPPKQSSNDAQPADANDESLVAVSNAAPATEESGDEPAADQPTDSEAASEETALAPAVEDNAAPAPPAEKTQSEPTVARAARPAVASQSIAPFQPNLLLTLGVPFGIGAMLMLLLWVILRGGGRTAAA